MSKTCWEEKLLGRHNKVGCLITFLKKQKQPPEVFYERDVLHNIHRTNRKRAVLEYLSNSEFWENFKSNYFEEHLRTAASKNVFMKNCFFNTNIRNKWKWGVKISWLASHEVCIYIQYFSGVARKKLQPLSIY